MQLHSTQLTSGNGQDMMKLQMTKVMHIGKNGLRISDLKDIIDGALHEGHKVTSVKRFEVLDLILYNTIFKS